MKKPLTKFQEEVLGNFFAQPIGKSYFLTGGTALSGFYFYHRDSIDLDRLSIDHRVATEGYHKFFLIGKNEELKIDLVREQKESYFVSLANKLLLEVKPVEG